MSLGSGEIRHRITIQVRQSGKDSNGDEIPVTWVTVCQPWARIEPQSGRELMLAQQANSQVRGRMKIRYRTGIDAGMRVVHRGRFYDIHAVMPDPESGIEWLTLFTGEGLSEG